MLIAKFLLVKTQAKTPYACRRATAWTWLATVRPNPVSRRRGGRGRFTHVTDPEEIRRATEVDREGQGV